MSRNMSRAIFVFASVVLLSSAPKVSWAQAGSSCYCLRPITQTMYQTMPVTEYQEVRHTVRRPVVETKHVERQVTEYRQVVESKTVDVPTVTYQDITEHRTIQRNCGHWVTRYHHRPRMSACQYDNRPDICGFLNRTSHVIRSAFTPRMIARREYRPYVQTQTIPVTRRVAIRGIRKVTYNVTRLVPYTTTRKVAVNTVRYVNEEVVSMRPVTVMRRVAVGSRTSYRYSPFTPQSTRSALRPRPDPVSSSKSRKNYPKRTANSRDKFDDDAFAPKKDAQDHEDLGIESSSRGGSPATRTSVGLPIRRSSSRLAHPAVRHVDDRSHQPVRTVARRLPSIVRVNGWRARRSTATGPVLAVPMITIAVK